MHTCTGIDVAGGASVEVSFDQAIAGVEHLITPYPDRVYVAPGWIDLQVNGFAGVDYCSPEAPQEEIARSIRELYSTGVTRFFPTVITGSQENMSGSLRNLARAKATLAEGVAMEGFHVEGPHISPDDGPRGAHPAEWVRKPDIEEYKRWQEAAGGNVRLITVSPEWPETPAYIEHVLPEGVVVSIGHMKATAAQIQAAVSAGATMSTHLGNGAHAVLPRHPNYIWEQLAEDRLAASFIVDGIHLSNTFLKVALRAKGVERSILITDAVMPAGCAPGPYKLGEVEVELWPGGDKVTLRGGTRLAGSALRMDQGVSNLMKMIGLSLPEAVTMATRNPARLGRVSHRQRGLATGERADLVLFRLDSEKNVQIEKTFVGGECVYSRD
ncbi:MAG: amidohydrolase family protein [Acidobacteria bacterium]|nr:amidohydrolase family protein [Acidobacteriota bacterium]